MFLDNIKYIGFEESKDERIKYLENIRNYCLHIIYYYKYHNQILFQSFTNLSKLLQTSTSFSSLISGLDFLTLMQKSFSVRFSI